MDKTGYLNKLRIYLADPAKKVWSDDLLSDLLDESLYRYCSDSGMFTGCFSIKPDSSGVYHYPEDFLRFKVGFNELHRDLTQTTGRELFVRSGWREKFGVPEHIYDDTSSFGEFCLYPDPSKKQRYEELLFSSEYGEVSDERFGVYAEGFGTTLSIDSFEYSGEIYYIRLGDFSEIRDHNGILYYSLFLAYNSDNEFSNAEIASVWLSRYKSRLGAFCGIDHINKGTLRSGNFY